jgi:hypothetical protein
VQRVGRVAEALVECDHVKAAGLRGPPFKVGLEEVAVRERE